MQKKTNKLLRGSGVQNVEHNLVLLAVSLELVAMRQLNERSGVLTLAVPHWEAVDEEIFGRLVILLGKCKNKIKTKTLLRWFHWQIRLERIAAKTRLWDWPIAAAARLSDASWKISNRQKSNYIHKKSSKNWPQVHFAGHNAPLSRRTLALHRDFWLLQRAIVRRAEQFARMDEPGAVIITDAQRWIVKGELMN